MQNAFGMPPRRRRPSINITSLIDVMFLLLIFFMVSATFRNRTGLDIALPEARTATRQDMRTHEVAVTESGAYHFDQIPVDAAQLKRMMETVAKKEPNSDVVLRADKRSNFGAVIRVVDIAREVGAARLIIPAGNRPE